MKNLRKFEKIIDFALRKSVFFPAAEIYSSHIAGFWDYGPLGTALKRKIIETWRKEIVERDGMLEIDGAQILPEDVFKASGHLSSFQDPLTKCKKCGKYFRADKLIEEKTGKIIPEAMPAEEFDKLIEKNKIRCPSCGGELSKVKMFNLMIQSNVGPAHQDKAYLRPETCQSIFLDFNRLYKTSRVKLPIGIAQVGKSFRNEISPRNAIHRIRELNQAEIEIFFNPNKEDILDEKFEKIKNYKLRLCLDDKEVIEVSCEDAVKKGLFSRMIAYYLALLMQFYEKLGIKRENMRFRKLADDEKAFYAKFAYDFEVLTSLGWSELVACNYRTDYDLKNHQVGSGQDLSVMDEDEKVLPFVFEMSMGIDRTLLAVIDNAYHEEEVKGEKRIVLKLLPKLAPIQVAVFPLVRRDGLDKKAKEVYESLKSCYPTFYDESGSIGRRYRRMDEIGTPFCITIDYDTMKDDTVTIRDRDTMEQIRIKIPELKNWIFEKIYF